MSKTLDNSMNDLMQYAKGDSSKVTIESEKHILKRQLVAKRRIFDVYDLKIKSPMDGQILEHSVVLHPNSVAVLAYFDNSLVKNQPRILVSHEYRTGIDKISYGIPAGLINKKETADQAVVRELKEETGYKVPFDRFKVGPVINSSEGFTNEQVHIYMVRLGDFVLGTDKLRLDQGVSRGETHFDPDEDVVVELADLSSSKVTEIHSAPGVVALLWLKTLNIQLL